VPTSVYDTDENLEESLMTHRLSELSILASLLLASACAHSAEYLASEQTRSLNLPFSDAVRVGDMLYLSGQLGNLPGTLELAPGGIEGEARQAMENIKAILERNGSSMDEIVKCTVMIADIAEWPKFNEVYVTYFPGHKPARSAFGAAGIALGGRVEVECWASTD
jgi:reactive intermediate/imine deaminase